MRCGWDLADVYRDRLTLRQVWVRIKALPPDAPLWAAVAADEDRSERARLADDIDAALTMMRGGS